MIPSRSMLIVPDILTAPVACGTVGIRTSKVVSQPKVNMEAFISTISISRILAFWEMEKPAAPIPASTKAAMIIPLLPRNTESEAPFQEMVMTPATQRMVPASVRRPVFSL